ncbi:MAG: hypothetical protein HY644_01290 [Acidobacteria bacterium]|nr:hypothetical protein [Acidobacteriota bacterium]
MAGRKDTVLSSFFAFEAPIVEPSLYTKLPEISRYFRRVYSYSTAQALQPFVCRDVSLLQFHIPQAYDDVFEHLWRKEDRKFLTMINSNKLPRLYRQELYQERLRALQHFGKNKEIDLYGVGWDRMPYRVGKTWLPVPVRKLYRRVIERVSFPIRPGWDIIPKIYKGPVRSKYETLSNYKFAICYENMILPGWITEKIFDCFFAGTVPVYLGAPDVTDYLSENAFIDKRKFPDYAALETFLRSLTDRAIADYKHNAREYLSSDRFRPFRKETFTELLAHAVGEDLGISIANTV